MILMKSKSYPVGTVRKRKTGKWIKRQTGHWQLLREIVSDIHAQDDVHPNSKSAKLMHTAARDVVRHASKHRIGYSREIAHRFLEDKYGHHGFKALWKHRTVEAAERYIKEMEAAHAGKTVHTEKASAIQKWLSDVKNEMSLLKTDAERDQWVSEKFAAKKKPIGHLLYACRQILGPGTHLSTVPDSGFRGLCKAIITKAYEHGPSGIDKFQIGIWNKAFNTMFKNADVKDQRVVPLSKALSYGDSKVFYKKHPKWFVYCCTRFAGKNDGMVNMGAIEGYMKNAMRKHGTKNPPSPTYDDQDGIIQSSIRMGMLDPNKVLKMSKKRFIQRKKAMERVYRNKKRLKKSSSLSLVIEIAQNLLGGLNG